MTSIYEKMGESLKIIWLYSQERDWCTNEKESVEGMKIRTGSLTKYNINISNKKLHVN